MAKRLSTIVREVLPLHTEVLEPVYSKIEIPFEQEVFTGLRGHRETYPTGSKRKAIMARVYEEVTRGFYGGELRDKKYYFKFSNLIRPDVYDSKNNIGYESKANVSGGSLNLGESQFRGYQLGQFLDPEMRLFYVIYRHYLRNIESRERYGNEVLEELFVSTLHSIVLPMSAIIDISRNPKFLGDSENDLLYSYSNGETSYSDCICFKSPTTNRLLVEPEVVLEELGLDSSRFEFERYLSPEGFRINGRPFGYLDGKGDLIQFPIMKISEKFHKEWFDQFKEWYELKYERDSIQLPLEDQPSFTVQEIVPKREKTPVVISEEPDDDLPF